MSRKIQFRPLVEMTVPDSFRADNPAGIDEMIQHINEELKHRLSSDHVEIIGFIASARPMENIIEEKDPRFVK